MSSRPSRFALTSPGAHRLYSTSELLRLPPPEWLIDGIIPKGGVVALYGPPGTYKTFVAMDMAMSVACGIPWQGHEAKKGFVAYIAAEGGTGISIRVAAWAKEHDMPESLIDVGWLTEAIPVYAESEDLADVMRRVSEEIERDPALIVIDTLARCFDGDENQQEDMGRFIGGVDRLRKEFGATVLVVHHTRLDGQRERGNTAFRGAADTMLAVGVGERHGDIRLTCSKQKDAEEFSELAFRAKVVALQLPGFTEFSTSVVIATEHGDRDAHILVAIRDAKDDGMTLKALVQKFKPQKSDPARKRGQAHTDGLSISPATIKRRLVSLVQSGKIVRKNAIYYLSGLNTENPVNPT